MRHIFIINPHAGKKDRTSHIYAMADKLRSEHGLTCECMLTDRPGAAEKMARRLAETGEELRLYACGGDGTAHEVANGIAGYDNAAMTVIPIGTGNDFLKNFGDDAALFEDAENLWDGDVFPIDLIQCGDRLALTIACCGIDARVGADVHTYSGYPLIGGRGSYVLSAVMNVIVKGIARRWTVTLDEESVTDDFSLVSVCNGRYYGGGSTPAARSRLDDGVLETVVIKKVSRLAFARLFGPYSDGRCEEFPDVARIVTPKEVRIASEGEELTVGLDGECFRTKEVTFRLAEKRVNIFGPKGCNINKTAK